MNCTVNQYGVKQPKENQSKTVRNRNAENSMLIRVHRPGSIWILLTQTGVSVIQLLVNITWQMIDIIIIICTDIILSALLSISYVFVFILFCAVSVHYSCQITVFLGNIHNITFVYTVIFFSQFCFVNHFFISIFLCLYVNVSIYIYSFNFLFFIILYRPPLLLILWL